MTTTFNSWGKILKSSRIELLLLALAYYCAARVGLYFAFRDTNISPWWPPSGVAMAAILWRGPRVWPAIACGAFAANLANFLGSQSPMTTSIGLSAIVSLGNTMECLLGYRLLNRFGTSAASSSEKDDHLAHPLGVVRFVALAGTLSCAVPASIGALSIRLAGLSDASDTTYLWWTWWTGDVVGILIVAPAILAWKYREGLREGGNYLEAFLLWLAATMVSVWVFGLTPFEERQFYPHAYLVMPFLMWAAFRFGRPGATLTLL